MLKYKLANRLKRNQQRLQIFEGAAVHAPKRVSLGSTSTSHISGEDYFAPLPSLVCPEMDFPEIISPMTHWQNLPSFPSCNGGTTQLLYDEDRVLHQRFRSVSEVSLKDMPRDVTPRSSPIVMQEPSEYLSSDNGVSRESLQDKGPLGQYVPQEVEAASLLILLKQAATAAKTPQCSSPAATPAIVEDLHSIETLPETPPQDDLVRPSPTTIKRKRTKKLKNLYKKKKQKLSHPDPPHPLSTTLPKSLATPRDSKELNSLHCFVRSELLEIFAVDSQQQDKDSRNQLKVGLRCKYCGHLSRAERRRQTSSSTMRSFFPKSIQDIYRGVCTWQRVHCQICPFIPKRLQEQYRYLKDHDHTRGKKQHWMDSALALGLRNVGKERNGVTYLVPEARL